MGRLRSLTICNEAVGEEFTVVALVVTLAVLGFVIPAVAAVLAYRRTMRIGPRIPDGPASYGDVRRWVDVDIPELFRARMSAVKWPAVWALCGIGCGAAASVLSVLVLQA